MNIVNTDEDNLIKKITETDWEFSNADTQYLTHNIHRYSGKFIPNIARRVIELLTKQGEIVLDPYVGSGTTILEAILLDRKAIGIDINPLAILISEVKTTKLDKSILLKFRETFISKIEELTTNQMSIFSESVDSYDPTKDSRFSDAWNKKWYQEHVLVQLIQIYHQIEILESEDEKRIAKVAFSDILRKFSNANSRYPNVMYDKNAKEKALPAKTFINVFMDIIDKLIILSGKVSDHNIEKLIIHGNNTGMSLDDSSVDAIITHPPYIAAVPYAEYGCLSLEWLGYSSKELDKVITGGKRSRKDVVDRFQNDYHLMLKESYRVLKKGKYIFLMVGNPTVRGEVIDLKEMTCNLGKDCGFEITVVETRVGKNRRGNKMGNEYLIFMKKP